LSANRNQAFKKLKVNNLVIQGSNVQN